MAVYEYENRSTGQRREIVASMKSPPALVIEDESGTWHRVWDFGVAVKGTPGAVNYKDGSPPVSRTLPLNDAPIVDKSVEGKTVVNIHADGTRSDQFHRRIVANKRDEAAHCRALNMERAT